MVEEHLGPAGELVLPLVEVGPLMQAAAPLDQGVTTLHVLLLLESGADGCQVLRAELLIPRGEVRGSIAAESAGGHLLVRIEEPSVGSLELGVAQLKLSPLPVDVRSFNRASKALVNRLGLGETERVHAIGTAEETGLARIRRHVLPTALRPATGHEPQLLLVLAGHPVASVALVGVQGLDASVVSSAVLKGLQFRFELRPLQALLVTPHQFD